MCANEWDNIEVKNIPSKALIKYIKALNMLIKMVLLELLLKKID